MGEAFLAFLPSLELMTHILTPSVREAPAEDTHNRAKISIPFYICLFSHDHCLCKAMDGKTGEFGSFVD
jgi:hypothetical protein